MTELEKLFEQFNVVESLRQIKGLDVKFLDRNRAQILLNGEAVILHYFEGPFVFGQFLFIMGLLLAKSEEYEFIEYCAESEEYEILMLKIAQLYSNAISIEIYDNHIYLELFKEERMRWDKPSFAVTVSLAICVARAFFEGQIIGLYLKID